MRQSAARGYTSVVNTLFMGFVGALALALGLAFGLGARETAGEMVRDWYQASREAAPKAERAAEIAQRQVGGGATQPPPNPTPNPGRGRG